MSLTFDELRLQNFTRRNRWHNPETEPWTGADWSNAMGGESGEAQNVVKKLRRHETHTSPQGDPSMSELLVALARELADVVTYADLLAAYYGINLGSAVAEKFNLVSERQGFPERLSNE